MEKGYYKPDIEEFCVGFEYESFADEQEDDRWCDLIFDDITPLSTINYGLKEDLIRVKLFCREDIEAEGFDHDQTTKDGAYFYKGTLMDKEQWNLIAENAMERKGGDYTLISINDINDINGNLHFYGRIRSRTEFRKLLKQLGI